MRSNAAKDCRVRRLRMAEPSLCHSQERRRFDRTAGCVCSAAFQSKAVDAGRRRAGTGSFRSPEVGETPGGQRPESAFGGERPRGAAASAVRRLPRPKYRNSHEGRPEDWRKEEGHHPLPKAGDGERPARPQGFHWDRHRSRSPLCWGFDLPIKDDSFLGQGGLSWRCESTTTYRRSTRTAR